MKQTNYYATIQRGQYVLCKGVVSEEPTEALKSLKAKHEYTAWLKELLKNDKIKSDKGIYTVATMFNDKYFVNINCKGETKNLFYKIYNDLKKTIPDLVLCKNICEYKTKYLPLVIDEEDKKQKATTSVEETSASITSLVNTIYNNVNTINDDITKFNKTIDNHNRDINELYACVIDCLARFENLEKIRVGLIELLQSVDFKKQEGTDWIN